VFPESVLPSNDRLPWLARPPPLPSLPAPPWAVLPLMVVVVTVRLPWLRTPPPPTPPWAVLPLMVVVVTVRLPWLRTPPPLAFITSPPVSVRPDRLAVTPGATCRTREAWWALTVTAPPPTIDSAVAVLPSTS